MNILLWVLQLVLAVLCIAGGAYQVFKIEELQVGVAAMRELPRGLWAFLGTLGCLTGLGLLVPRVTPIAATIVAVQSVLISAFYIYFRDFAPLPFSAAMAIMATFISYGRFVLKPF